MTPLFQHSKEWLAILAKEFTWARCALCHAKGVAAKHRKSNLDAWLRLRHTLNL